METANQMPYWLSPNHPFGPTLNDALYRERVALEFVEFNLIERSSEELHVEVVQATLRLLAGRSTWASIERAYRNALDEIANDKADDAITDAASALQEAFALVGCKGNALGPLIKDARTKGILAPHDQTLGDAISKIADWVSADRSEFGDGHRGASGANREDAWFTVHVVGALILRLASGPRSGHSLRTQTRPDPKASRLVRGRLTGWFC